MTQHVGPTQLHRSGRTRAEAEPKTMKDPRHNRSRWVRHDPSAQIDINRTQADGSSKLGWLRPSAQVEPNKSKPDRAMDWGTWSICMGWSPMNQNWDTESRLPHVLPCHLNWSSRHVNLTTILPGTSPKPDVTITSVSIFITATSICVAGLGKSTFLQTLPC